MQENIINSTREEKEAAALKYVEERGVSGYKVKGNRLVYYVNQPESLSFPRRTYKVTVRLDTMHEERKLLKKVNQKGEINLRK